MKRTVQRTALFALLTSSAMAATPLLAEPLDIASVEVEANLEAVDSNALDRWPDIAEDLTLAITAGLNDQMEEDGDYDVRVDVTEISNLGATYLSDDGEFNQLEGWVYIDGPGSEEPLKKYHIMLKAEELEGFKPVHVAIVPPDRAAFYDAMVMAFADQVVTDVSELQTDWLVPDQADDKS
ncbi:hypothetical protein [Celeribacter persicus]|uniref:Uncharacterized protein n=1 Tax=Celeribacter persicus TaxID=1651082 RepID=A0A2T5H8Y3_9RHOB|nr:hypothetical protein [Celeribacter persicus]PTQ68023.1 hypothetical protein C8N42_11638 [Celeribacter persicus]